jgi:hypothetical protein
MMLWFSANRFLNINTSKVIKFGYEERFKDLSKIFKKKFENLELLND